jgi:hypothetical protein
VATSFGYRLFEAESVNDIPFEQYRVLVALINKMDEELEDYSQNYNQSANSPNTSGGRTTYRIINQD